MKGCDGQLLDFFGFGFAQLGGNDQLRAFIEILGGVVVEFFARDDLARDRSCGLVVAQHRAFDFAGLVFLAAYAFFDHDLAVELGGFFDRRAEFLAVVGFAKFLLTIPGSPASRIPDTSACSRPASATFFGSLSQSLRRTVTCFTMGSPAALNNDFMMSLSMPAAEPSTPAPT